MVSLNPTWYQKNHDNEMEVKSLETDQDTPVENESFTAFLRGEQSVKNRRVAPRTAYIYSANVAWLEDATGKIISRIKTLRYGISDIEKDEVTYSHDVLTRMRSPGEGSTKSQFIAELFKSYLLTNEGWVVARGNINRPPLAQLIIRPYYVDVTIDQRDGLPSMIKTCSERDRRTYKRQIINGRIRYIDEMELNEIFPIMGELDIDQEFRAQSPISSLLDDLEQTRSGKTHNLSLLKNGAKPSMTIGPKQGNWNEKAVKDLSEFFRSNQQGENKAGNVNIVGKPMDIDTSTLTNVEMDFMNMLNKNEQAGYNKYNVPLSMISTEAMTMDNYKIAQRSLYTEAVLPVFSEVMNVWLECLAPRYNDIDGYVMKVDLLAIGALSETRVDQMKALRETRSVNINEVRQAGGYEDSPGADSIMVGANEVPLAAADILPGVDGLPDDLQDEITGTPATGDASVQQTALNGAQTQALASLVSEVLAGNLPKESAIAIARAAFPLIPEGLIDAMFSAVVFGVNKPEESEGQDV